MRTHFKKEVSASIMAMMLALMLSPLMPVDTYAADTFSDVQSNDPSVQAISSLKSDSVIHGYPDGTFKSKDNINRAEFLKIVVGSMSDFNAETENGSNCFPDVKDEWYAKYVCYADEKGIIEGYPDGTFRPAENINFAEASKIVINAFDIDPTDTEQTDPWYKTFVEPLGEKKAIPLSVSDLDKFIARGEMAEVIYRVKENETTKPSLKYHDLEGVPLSGQSCSALDELIEEANTYPMYRMYMEDDMAVDMEEAADSDGSTANSAVKTEGSNDFSTTNVQVAGVDEADFVKNDGEYIYSIQNGTIRVVKAYPAESMELVTEIDAKEIADNYVNQMYLDGDKLIVMGSLWSDAPIPYGEGPADEMILPYPYFHENKTIVAIYDVSDPSNPELDRKITMDGDYTQSRKVDDTLYLILNKSINTWSYAEAEYSTDNVLPVYADSENGETETRFADCEDLTYFPRTHSLNYVIAAAIPLEGGELSSEVMVGDGYNVYASRNNLYLTGVNYDDADGFYFDYNNAKTVVYRYAISPGNIEYKGRGKVPGTVLNQFSLDEEDGYLRIATTSGSMWDQRNPSSNNLYVLNSQMNVVSSIEDIAPGERIYSTRFIGDRGYMVTFKKVDPLFAFDLSDPLNPKILGKLKIPGYSDYLHPYDENHIIGFGKDAVEATDEDSLNRDIDFAWYQGMKIAMFDVTDPTNPTQMFTELIGDRGTESQLLYDHKALLFDRSKNLMAFPVRVAEVAEGGRANTYGYTVFNGAYVYTVDLENGFTKRGEITHLTEEDELKAGDNWYSYYSKNIDRILYIGENLYTVSRDMIKANNIDTITEVNSLELPSYEFKYDDVVY